MRSSTLNYLCMVFSFLGGQHPSNWLRNSDHLDDGWDVLKVQYTFVRCYFMVVKIFYFFYENLIPCPQSMKRRKKLEKATLYHNINIIVNTTAWLWDNLRWIFMCGLQAIIVYCTDQRIYISERRDSTPLRLPNICPPNLSSRLLCQTVR